MSMRGQEQVEKRRWSQSRDVLRPRRHPRLPHTMGVAASWMMVITNSDCPAVGEGPHSATNCGSYQEVRRLADLSVEEMQYFEEAMSLLAAAEYCEILTCPQCRTSVERKDLSNLCVRCSICTADLKKT
ncbi:hypothetical protein KUCAC02_000422 [Chaenocephalus aceratus]|uniref:Uncharacterized protein n=1 Tax=Chaenocephalus aceratus TaxID=36190 RepID=A0ACB9W5K3_CHAAC|nr:hypothetical protein KUCAC02_000422 [Chaenocephalus aceratus]